MRTDDTQNQQLVVIEVPHGSAAEASASLLHSVSDAIELSSRRLLRVYVLPQSKLGLIDCLQLDIAAASEIAAHLDALGMVPVWRRAAGALSRPADSADVMRSVRAGMRSYASDAAARPACTGHEHTPAVLLQLGTAARAADRPRRQPMSAVTTAAKAARAAREAGEFAVPRTATKKPPLDMGAGRSGRRASGFPRPASAAPPGEERRAAAGEAPSAAEAQAAGGGGALVVAPSGGAAAAAAAALALAKVQPGSEPTVDALRGGVIRREAGCTFGRARRTAEGGVWEHQLVQKEAADRGAAVELMQLSRRLEPAARPATAPATRLRSRQPAAQPAGRQAGQPAGRQAGAVPPAWVERLAGAQQTNRQDGADEVRARSPPNDESDGRPLHTSQCEAWLDGSDELDAELELGAITPRRIGPGLGAPAGCYGGAPPLRSRHSLPHSGNWVRMAAAQQQRPRTRGVTARERPSDGGTFGGQPRQSASRRWAHQTDLPFTKRPAVDECADGPGAAACAEAVPGSFLPLKMFASTLAPRAPLRDLRRLGVGAARPSGEARGDGLGACGAAARDGRTTCNSLPEGSTCDVHAPAAAGDDAPEARTKDLLLLSVKGQGLGDE